MKKLLLLWLMCVMSTVCTVAQRTYTFKAGVLNVDGLPEKIAGVTVNEGGHGAEGTTVANNYLANTGWDIIGVAEDFNYHEELTAAPFSDYYNFGAHGGSVGVLSILRSDTDGLGIAVAKWLNFPGADTKGTVYTWTAYNGYTNNGADGLVTKGFRMYTVTFDTGIAVDVYVLHMDAGSSDGDISMRETQLGELATQVIKNTNTNKRPVIIIGDTNCRYTRENLKAGFIDVINAEAQLTIKDAWVELIHNGEYPVYPSESMMTHTYGNQKGEVVDKVFYINSTETDIILTANNYWNDAASLTISDHTPVMVNFTIEDPNGTPVDNTLPGPDGEVVETWNDAAPSAPTTDITGKEYYLRNVYSGLFFKACNNWGSHFGEGRDGLPVTMTLVSGNTYKLATPTLGRYVGNNYYADNGTADEGNWVVEEVKSTSNLSNTKTKYVFRNSANTSMAISSMANGTYVDGLTYSVSDSKQQWELYTYDEMIAAVKEEMDATITGSKYNASALITQPVCNLALDSRHQAWSFAPSIGGAGGGSNESCVWEVFRDGVSHAFDMNQTLTGIPNGTYTLTVQAFFRNGDANTSSTTVEPVLYAGNQSTKICSILDYALASQPSWTHGHHNAAGWIPNDMWQANQWFKAGHYTVTLSNITVTDGTLKIGIKNTSTATSMAWCCFDNFQLLWHGTNEGDIKATETYKSIKAAVDEANALIATYPEEVQKAYDISDVKWRYNNELLSVDGSVEQKLINEAVALAIKAQTGIGADLTLAITNHSFEMGNLTGWNNPAASDTGAKLNSDGTYTTDGADGNYIFNTWASTETCPPLTQAVTDLNSGYYKLKALVTSVPGNYVYLIANNQYAGTNAFTTDKAFVEHEVKFVVEDGVANIATVASRGGKFNYPEGAYFKSDNYRLEYLGTLAEGRVALALAEVKERAETLTPEAKAKLLNDIAKYDADDYNPVGDGLEEKVAIYTALKEATLSQRAANTEMTWVIRNHSFQTGDWNGWTVVTGWDTHVLHQSHNNHANGAEGLYIFNTWNDQVDPLDTKAITQTIEGLPNGKYRLTVAVTSYEGKTVYAFANGEAGGVTATATDEMVEASVEFNVTDGTATIGAVGEKEGVFNQEAGCFYKADNFRLTFLNNEVTLNEADTEIPYQDGDWYTSVALNRNIKAGNWSTFVVPFDMEKPEGWEVKYLSAATQNKDVISMTFSDASSIEAGTPYMVRTSEDWNGTTVENVTLTSALNEVDGSGIVTFKGNYISGNVPTDAFFISSNKFYQAINENNTLKAFRGYFEATGAAGVNVLNFTFDDEVTGIDTTVAEPTAEVIAIYSLDGRRIESLQRGVNIVKLSNGKTKKLIVK